MEQMIDMVPKMEEFFHALLRLEGNKCIREQMDR
jgi:hypothetical protein